jgi:MarR family transcriptional regulator, organic hydroperoxide resistance regulator
VRADGAGRMGGVSQRSVSRQPGPPAVPPTAVGPESWPTGRLLSVAARRVERAWDAYLERWSLSHATLPVLAVLAGGPHSQREVAGALKVTEQTMSRMLAGLEHVGYVRRETHAADRRRHVVAITEAGLSALEAIDDPAVLERMVSTSLTAEQMRELCAMLLRIVEPEQA